MTPEERQKRQERRAIVPEMERRDDGTVILRKLGCVGVGPSVIEAIHDLHRKVDLAYNPPMSEEERQEDDREEEWSLRVIQAIAQKYEGDKP